MTQSNPPSPGPLLIIQTGNTFAEVRNNKGDFADWIAAGLASTQPCLRLDAHTGATLPPPSSLAGVVISGSHAMVTDREEWSERLAAWLKNCVAEGIPVLGICYGHQLLAHALGGQVGYREQGIEIGTHTLTLAPDAADDALFQQMPPTFPAHLVHSQSVLALPPGATLLASSAAEPHQAFVLGNCAWGVQFHPEFSADVMRSYIQQKSAGLAKQQQDPDALLAAVQHTPHAASLLQRFAHALIRNDD